MLTGLQAYDLKLLKTFCAVVDSGGFSAAQVRLGRSLSAISGDVHALELRLGSQLCRRGRSGFSLTEYGQHIHAACRHLFEAVTRFESDVELTPGHLVGPLRIAVNEGQHTDPSFVLAAALGRFLDRPHNRVRPTIAIASFERTLEMLINGELEVGFGYFHAVEHPQVTFLPLYLEPNQVYCGKGHSLFTVNPQSLTWEQVRQHAFVWRGESIRSHHPAIFSEADTRITSVGMTPESRAYLILSGHYLGYLAEHQAARWVQAGMLRPIMPDLLRLEATAQAAVKKGAKLPRHVRTFLADYYAVAQEDGITPLAPFPVE